MENFTQTECCNCGVVFAVSNTLKASWKETRNTFYCPNGHPQYFRKSTADILKEDLEQTKRTNEYLLNEKIELIAQKEKLERKLKRKK